MIHLAHAMRALLACFQVITRFAAKARSRLISRLRIKRFILIRYCHGFARRAFYTAAPHRTGNGRLSQASFDDAMLSVTAMPSLRVRYARRAQRLHASVRFIFRPRRYRLRQ